MSLYLTCATTSDVDEIATLHLTSFATNPLLHAQFPTPAALSFLHSVLAKEMLYSIEHLRDSKAVLVIRQEGAGEKIVSFAKWDLPRKEGEGEGVGREKVSWHEDVRTEWLDGYHKLSEEAKERVVGSGECYRMTFVGTLPEHRGIGAATILTQWGLERAKKYNIPVYLESTIAASSIYKRLGFIALDGLSMKLPAISSSKSQNIYEELGMLRTWDDSDFDYWDSSLSIASLHEDYEAGMKPQLVVQAVFDRIEAYKQIQPSVWLYLQPIGEVMRAASELYTRWPDAKTRPLLWGVPFSVKDSVDVADIQTTIGCPALASTPSTSAPVYQHCTDAGALFIGKTNMEQLATGMTGCRSPYGQLHSFPSPSHCVGGSSSGSAVSVRAGLVSFSIGSDTAGSIRVPALFNGIVGFKPTKGTVSARGIAPASLHQDCVSFLTTNIADVERVWNICKGFDKGDVFAKLPSQIRPISPAGRELRFRFGVPPARALKVCSPIYLKQFNQVIDAIARAGGKRIEMDWAPFHAANELLYNSTFVLERLTMFPDNWYPANASLLHPVTQQVFSAIHTRAQESSAVEVFKDLQKQASYKRTVESILTFVENIEDGVDEITLMIVPTAPFHPTIEEVERDPVGINGRLGSFAHFANVLDLVGVAVPCRMYESDGVELPFGVTILAGMGLDGEALRVVKGLEEVLGELGSEK